MADIVYREIGLGMYEAELVSDAVQQYLGSSAKRKIVVEGWHLDEILAAADREGFTTELDMSNYFDDEPFGSQYDL